MEQSKIRFSIDVEVSLAGIRLVGVSTEPRIARPRGRPTKAESVALDAGISATPEGRLKEVCDRVESFLANGPRMSNEVFEEFRGDYAKQRLSKRDIFHAAKALKIIKRPQGHGKDQYWIWELPSKGE